MKICDRCGSKDDNHHNAVGSVGVRTSGYHYEHWTHRNVPSNWSLDLCPICAGILKSQVDCVIKQFKRPL